MREKKRKKIQKKEISLCLQSSLCAADQKKKKKFQSVHVVMIARPI